MRLRAKKCTEDLIEFFAGEPAVGILVDDATVEVENINRNREAEPSFDPKATSSQPAVDVAAVLSAMTFPMSFMTAEKSSSASLAIAAELI